MKRYTSRRTTDMTKCEDGMWVNFEAYAAVKKELAELKALLQQIQEMCKPFPANMHNVIPEKVVIKRIYGLIKKELEG